MIRAQAGRLITLRLVNRGQIAHQFEMVALRIMAVTVAETAQARLRLRFRQASF